jgi:hypothetical protein
MRKRLALAALLVCAACRSLPFPDPSLEGEYGAALKKWTRSVTLYSGLETRAFVRVVYLSPEFVEAQARELSKMRAELPDKAAETRTRMREQYRAPTFFAVAYMPDRTANDWSYKESIWRIAVNVGTGERSPQKIDRFEVPFNAEQRALYPYLDDYSVGYLIHFPPMDAAATYPLGNADLIAAGAPGIMRFHWRTDGSEPPSASEAGPEQKRPETPKPP